MTTSTHTGIMYNTPIGIVGVRMKGFIEKLEELLELGGTKRDLKRPCIAFH